VLVIVWAAAGAGSAIAHTTKPAITSRSGTLTLLVDI
jgi:hypothetical protein